MSNVLIIVDKFFVVFFVVIFFLSCGFYFSWKTKCKHIPVVSRALLRGDSWRRSLLYKYLAHTINRTRVYLQRGGSLAERGGSGRRQVRGGEGRVCHWFQKWRRCPRGASPHQQVWLCLALLTSIRVSALEKIKKGRQASIGSSVHSVGRAKGCRLYPTSIGLALTDPLLLPFDPACELPSFSCSFILTDRYMAKYLKTNPFYAIESISPKRKKKGKKTHQEISFQHLKKVP